MQCPTCQNEARKFGKDRHGNQRYQCLTCRKTFSDIPAKPLDEMRIPMDKALDVLGLLTEGMSIRASSRRTGVAKDTIIALLVCVGQKCEEFLAERLKDVPAKNVQADEIWGWVKMKEKVRVKKGIESEEVGDAYCYTPSNARRNSFSPGISASATRSTPPCSSTRSRTTRAAGSRFRHRWMGAVSGSYPRDLR